MFQIAISGKANSGKNTVFTLLKQELELEEDQVRDNAFANPIKEGLLKLYPSALREELYGPSHLRSKIIPGTRVTYREVLCDLGAQARRYDEDHWVNILEMDFKETLFRQMSSGRLGAYIVTDLRFPNEYDRLKKLKFFTIRVKRNDSLQLSDVSETSQDKLPDDAFDAIIDNNSTLEALREKCKEVCRRMKSSGSIL